MAKNQLIICDDTKRLKIGGAKLSIATIGPDWDVVFATGSLFFYASDGTLIGSRALSATGAGKHFVALNEDGSTVEAVLVCGFDVNGETAAADLCGCFQWETTEDNRFKGIMGDGGSLLYQVHKNGSFVPALVRQLEVSDGSTNWAVALSELDGGGAPAGFDRPDCLGMASATSIWVGGRDFQDPIGTVFNLAELDETGSVVSTALIRNADTAVSDIAFDSSGNQFCVVIDEGDNSVHVYRNGSLWQTLEVATQGPLSAASLHLTIDSADAVIVSWADVSSVIKVRKYSAAGATAWTINPTFGCQAIVADDDDNLYIAGVGSGSTCVAEQRSGVDGSSIWSTTTGNTFGGWVGVAARNRTYNRWGV